MRHEQAAAQAGKLCSCWMLNEPFWLAGAAPRLSLLPATLFSLSRLCAACLARCWCLLQKFLRHRTHCEQPLAAAAGRALVGLESAHCCLHARQWPTLQLFLGVGTGTPDLLHTTPKAPAPQTVPPMERPPLARLRVLDPACSLCLPPSRCPRCRCP